jgi:hypothetical protein
MPSFDLETVQADNGTVTVTGRWHGVRGRRFMRPSLTPVGDGGGARLLADLEHKPWAAQDGEQWVAVFAWDGALSEAEALELAVAPDLVVQIPPPGRNGARDAKPRKASGPAAKRRSAATERDTALAERDAARQERDQAVRGRQQAEARSDELSRELDAAVEERERLAAQCDEARGRIERLTRELAEARDQHLAVQRETERMSGLVADQEVRWREAQVRADRVSGERDNALKDAAVLRARVKELEAADESRNSGTEALQDRLETLQRELAQTREALAQAERRPGPEAAPIPAPLRVRSRLDWTASPHARYVALGAFLVVLAIVLIIVAGH